MSCLLRPRSRGGQNKNRSASAIQAQSCRFKAAASGNASPAFFRPMNGPLAIGVEVRLGLVSKRGEGLIQWTTQTPRRSLFNQTLLGPVLFLFVRLCLLLSTCMWSPCQVSRWQHVLSCSSLSRFGEPRRNNASKKLFTDFLWTLIFYGELC